jgi:hypothetical protein
MLQNVDFGPGLDLSLYLNPDLDPKFNDRIGAYSKMQTLLDPNGSRYTTLIHNNDAIKEIPVIILEK